MIPSIARSDGGQSLFLFLLSCCCKMVCFCCYVKLSSHTTNPSCKQPRRWNHPLIFVLLLMVNIASLFFCEIPLNSIQVGPVPLRITSTALGSSLDRGVRNTNKKNNGNRFKVVTFFYTTFFFTSNFHHEDGISETSHPHI